VIPQTLRKQVLDIAHETHQGITKTKSLLREKVWWPHIDKDIEDTIKNCIPCLSVSTKSSPEPLKPNKMGNPWGKMHIDICGPFPTGESILDIFDASTRWPDFHIIKSTNSKTITQLLDITFSTHGYSETIVTDNAANLTSVDISQYCIENGIKHHKSIPYYPQGNAEIERFYRTIEKTIRTTHAEGKDWKLFIYKFLLTY
jgi:hypothetical protein